MTPGEASVLPILALVFPTLAALGAPALGRWPNVREASSITFALATLATVVALLPSVGDGAVRTASIVELAPGLDVTLRADAAGMIFATLAAGLWVLAAIYSIGYMRGHAEQNQSRFYAAFALSIGAALGVAFAGNLLTFVLFYELLTLFTYPLIVHRQTGDAIRIGRKYLAYTLSGGLALIGATAWIYALDLDGTFTPGGFLDAANLSDGTLWGLLVLLMVGVSVKAAVMPVHGWLVGAMVAPTPVTALLHAVAVVKAGVFGVVRMMLFVFGAGLLDDMGAGQIVAVIAAITLVLGSVLALRHDNLKRRLAYSTISHLAYIVLGVALLGPLALTGALLHLVGHGVTKITLFFCAGAIDVHTHRERVSELDGIGRQMPITMAAFTMASLSMVGIPPFVIFGSKWLLGSGAAQVGQPVFLIVYMVSGVLSAAYLLPIVYRAFWRTSPAFPRFGEASWLMVAPLSLTALLALALGIAPNVPFGFLDLAASVAGAMTGAR